MSLIRGHISEGGGGGGQLTMKAIYIHVRLPFIGEFIIPGPIYGLICPCFGSNIVVKYRRT